MNKTGLVPSKAPPTVQLQTEERKGEGKVTELDFLKLLAHDIKSPIHNMKLCLDLLSKRYEQISSDSYFAMMERCLNQMQDMAKTLLDLAIHDGSEVKIQPSVVNVRDLVFELMAHYGAQARGRGITLKASFEGKLCSAYIDPLRIRSVLSNLLQNALKYSPENTDVEIFTMRTAEEIVFAIYDEGVGVPNEQRGKLFQPLAKLYQKPLDGTLSHGLGLALCSTLVRSHGGSIGYRPREDKGSCFYFRIPQKF